MIEDHEITGILGELREIEPSAGFAARSRGTILSTPRLPVQAGLPRRTWGLYGLKHSLTEGLGFALSVGLVSIIAILFLSVPKTLGPVIGNRMPGADTAALINDVDAAVKDIDIHMQEVQLFDTAAEKAGSALKEAANDNASHTNPSLIEKESLGVTAPATTEPVNNIDNILNQLIK